MRFLILSVWSLGVYNFEALLFFHVTFILCLCIAFLCINFANGVNVASMHENHIEELKCNMY